MANTPTATATATASRGFPVFAFATMVLFVLKVGNVASFGDISWWLVFAPLLLGLGIALIFLVIFLIIVLIAVWND